MACPMNVCRADTPAAVVPAMASEADYVKNFKTLHRNLDDIMSVFESVTDKASAEAAAAKLPALFREMSDITTDGDRLGEPEGELEARVEQLNELYQEHFGAVLRKGQELLDKGCYGCEKLEELINNMF